MSKNFLLTDAVCPL